MLNNTRRMCNFIVNTNCSCNPNPNYLFDAGITKL